VVYVTGELNHAVVFPRPTIDGQTVDFFRVGGNDILYGGLGDDFIHGGEGEDAISGAEALPFYHQPNPWIPLARVYGYALTYDEETNTLTWKTNGVAEVRGILWWMGSRERFLFYDEYDPLRKIMVRAFAGIPTSPDGVLVKHPTGTFGEHYFDFLLNFDPTVDDGKDVLFGDGGNDWLVGGTNADRMYGGWGDDLLNADDNHDTTKPARTDPWANNIARHRHATAEQRRPRVRRRRPRHPDRQHRRGPADRLGRRVQQLPGPVPAIRELHDQPHDDAGSDAVPVPAVEGGRRRPHDRHRERRRRGPPRRAVR
jgi:hypothetical protein